ncbi:ABC transporter substrate-binding protein [Pseudophaeobacter sp.]|uniref:ABC transporter substrate-binding protein n=1 Tax=Pseudophaeobacter sp. TaxID=1971739 RepID=UPI004057DBC8
MRLCSLLTSVLVLPVTGAMATDYPLILTDARPAEVIIERQPEKIITLGALPTDVLVALGHNPIGVTTYGGEKPRYLADKLQAATDVGDLTSPNLELMASLEPDLVAGLLRYNAPFADEISVFANFIAADFGDSAVSDKSIALLAEAYGAGEKAVALNSAFAQLRADLRVEPQGDAPTFLFIWHYFDTMYAHQNNLMAAEILSGLGAENLVGFNPSAETADQAVKVVEAEDLLLMDPDVLLVFTSHGDTVKHNRVFDQLTAVKTGRAHMVGFQYSQPGGPIARELVLREGAHLLFPDRHARPDGPDGAMARPIEFAK